MSSALGRSSIVVWLIGLCLLAAAVVVLVDSATGGDDEPGETAVTRDVLAGQEVRLAMPTGGEKPRGLLLYFHGQGSGVDDKIDGSFLGPLRDAGWAVATSAFHDESWGNPASTEDTQRLTDWAERRAGLPVTMWVSGSMGGAVSLNAMLHGVRPPPCWYGVKPAISLQQMGDVPKAPQFISEAFGGPVPEDRNPIQNLGDLPDDVRYRVVASPDDTQVRLVQNGGVMVDSLDGREVDISYKLVQGPHEDPSHFDGVDLKDFALNCVEGSNIPDAGDRAELTLR